MTGKVRGIIFVGTAALTFALAACGGGKTVTAENASTAEVAQKVKESGVADDVFLSAGRWQMRMTVNDMKIPGMPPEVAERMKSQMGQARTVEHCVTEEEAKKPKEGFFTGENSKQCRYENFTMGGGKISMVMHCGSEQGSQTMKMDGTYGPEAYRMTMTSTAQAKGGTVGAMTFNATVDAKRLGVCTGKEKG